MGRPPGPGAGAPRGSATNAAERCPVRRPRTSTRLGASLRSPAATLALALAAALLGGCGAAPVASPRSTTTTGTSAAPGASAAAGAVASSGSGTSGGASGAPYDWTAAQLPRLGGGASTTLAAIVPPGTTGGVWSVVGTVTGAGGATTATVWVSSDGRAWTPERLAGTDGRALGAAADGSRTIVVGSVGRGARRRAEVWITPGSGGPPRPVADQASLRAAIGGRSGATAASAMDLVAAGTVGIVASGTVGGRSALWYSSDGTTWSQEPVAERLFGRRHATLSALAVDPNGILAAGTAHDGTRYAAVLWGSPNGIRWAEVGSFGPPGDHAVAGLAWNGRELVAAGGARESAAWSPAAWVSPGAGAWSEPIEAFPRSFPAAGTRPSVLRAVAADPVATAGSDSLVAAGGAPGSPELWTSVDGQVWAPLPLPSAPPGATADLVGVRGSTTVVADSEPGQPLVWVRRAGRWATVPPSSFGGLRSTATPVALARAQGRLWLAVDVTRGASPVGRAVILASVGGRRWSPAAVLAGARLSDLTAGATGLVATGTFGSRPAVWTSPDGTRWSHPDSLPGALSATAAAEVSGSTVVVGTTRLDRGAEPTAGAWHSTAAGWSPLGTLATTPTLDPQRPLAACAAAVPAAASTGTTSTTSPTAGSTGSATGGSGGGSAATTVVAAVGWSTRTGPPPTGGSRSSTATTIPVAGSGPGVGGQQDNGTQAAAWWLAGGRPTGGGHDLPPPRRRQLRGDGRLHARLRRVRGLGAEPRHRRGRAARPLEIDRRDELDPGAPRPPGLRAGRPRWAVDRPGRLGRPLAGGRRQPTGGSRAGRRPPVGGWCPLPAGRAAGVGDRRLRDRGGVALRQRWQDLAAGERRHRPLGWLPGVDDRRRLGRGDPGRRRRGRREPCGVGGRARSRRHPARLGHRHLTGGLTDPAAPDARRGGTPAAPGRRQGP